jgi:hypothetical protein
MQLFGDAVATLPGRDDAKQPMTLQKTLHMSVPPTLLATVAALYFGR